MKIYEAVPKASELGKGIVRECYLKQIHAILPTNSYNGCIGMIKSSTSELRRWNPSSEDLMADDWLVVDIKE